MGYKVFEETPLDIAINSSTNHSKAMELIWIFEWWKYPTIDNFLVDIWKKSWGNNLDIRNWSFYTFRNWQKIQDDHWIFWIYNHWKLLWAFISIRDDFNYVNAAYFPIIKYCYRQSFKPLEYLQKISWSIRKKMWNPKHHFEILSYEFEEITRNEEGKLIEIKKTIHMIVYKTDTVLWFVIESTADWKRLFEIWFSDSIKNSVSKN